MSDSWFLFLNFTISCKTPAVGKMFTSGKKNIFGKNFYRACGDIK